LHFLGFRSFILPFGEYSLPSGEYSLPSASIQLMLGYMGLELFPFTFLGLGKDDLLYCILLKNKLWDMKGARNFYLLC